MCHPSYSEKGGCVSNTDKLDIARLCVAFFREKKKSHPKCSQHVLLSPNEAAILHFMAMIQSS